MAPRHTPFRACVAIAVALGIGVAGCGGDDDSAGDPERFCGEVKENKKLLTQPAISEAEDPEAAIDSLLAEYRRIGEYAPLAIEQEWEQLIAAYEMADQVIPGDEQSEQEAVAAIFRAEKAAVAISDWLKENCRVGLGRVETIVVEATTTTVDPATTEAP